MPSDLTPAATVPPKPAGPSRIARFRRSLRNYALLFLVVAVMALKPTAGDIATLAGLAAALVVGVVLAFTMARAPVPATAGA